ncbi:hypothetical protein ACQP2C_12300 [Micromonospora zamorensis]|uniref:hypothetical protein n=1 Tax=Micromonospora zamorensis TaxID=709883 RepID=UPI003D99B554
MFLTASLGRDIRRTLRAWLGPCECVKRDARVRLPWDRALHGVNGLPYLRPEIALLHKAHLDSPKDRADLAAAVLDADARTWLSRTPSTCSVTTTGPTTSGASYGADAGPDLPELTDAGRPGAGIGGHHGLHERWKDGR